MILRLASWIAGVLICSTTIAMSDPCGMVPPLYTGPGVPISRVGLQQTYVFFDQGVESFVIRPGFQGRVDNFGMLIPFPSAPAIRKVPDNVFEQIASAVDPPEVVVNLRPMFDEEEMADAFGMGGRTGGGGMAIRRHSVRVLKEEAVGMYEVAVLEAGSPEALKRWMEKNKYQYPEGMDKVVEDYVNESWCFVAVKTKVGSKADSDPKPGKRNADPKLPEGGVFDGNVQGLGFRFKTEKLVVPMRLSAFNGGDLRNVVYLLTRGGKRIRSIPQEYVVRQIAGNQLVKNVTEPLPLRIIGGKFADIGPARKKGLAEERDPNQANGIAKYLFTSDVMATSLDGFSHQFEETEKELLRIGEHFDLRGIEIDKLIEKVSSREAEKMVDQAIPKLKQMTLTVVDGDFPRAVIASQNLTFADFQMARALNRIEKYDTKTHQPGGKREGILISAYQPSLIETYDPTLPALGSLGLISFIGWLTLRRKKNGNIKDSSKP